MKIYEQDFSPICNYIDLTLIEYFENIVTFKVKNSPEIVAHLEKCYFSSSHKCLDEILLHYIVTEKTFMLYLQLSKRPIEATKIELSLSDIILEDVTSGLRLNEREVAELLAMSDIIV